MYVCKSFNRNLTRNFELSIADKMSYQIWPLLAFQSIIIHRKLSIHSTEWLEESVWTKTAMTTKPFGDLVGSIDEGTSSARFVLFKAGTAEIVCFHQIELQQITPVEGWVEQDPTNILDVVNECIEKTIEKLTELGGSVTVSLG